MHWNAVLEPSYGGHIGQLDQASGNFQVR